MSEIAEKCNLTLKDGLYYKVGGSPWKKSNGCNFAVGKLKQNGYKVIVVPVDKGFALRATLLPATSSTANAPQELEQQTAPEKPAEGKEKSLQDLRKEVEEFEERKELEGKLAALRGESPADEPQYTRGNKPDGRPKRKPFKRNVLDYPKVPGYVRRVINVEDGSPRLQDFLEDGWEIDPEHNVKVDVDGDANRPSRFGSAIARPVGTNDQKKPIMGVLMRKRQDWYDADQVDKQKEQAFRMRELTRPPQGEGLHTLTNENAALKSMGREAEADKTV